MVERIIFHVDMDAFFASVEQRDHPAYRGKPVIVGGLSGRGVVSTCSYEARACGVRSAMPMAEARKRCPEAIFVEGRYHAYREASDQIFAILEEFSPMIEPLSIDEAFLDMTGMGLLMDSPRRRAGELKEAIRAKTGLRASVGIAPNKFLAKLASDLEKPDGLVEIRQEDVERVLSPLPIRRLWGVGKKTEARLAALGLKTVGDIAAADAEKLRSVIGDKAAQVLPRLARGIDDRPVVTLREAKSVGKEMTFDEDLSSVEDAHRMLLLLSEKVGWRLRRAGRKARTVSVKVRRGDFTTYTRSRTLPEATNYDDAIFETAKLLFDSLGIRGSIRLLGVTGEHLETAGQTSLFDDPRQEKLYAAIDRLKGRFGEGIIGKAGH